MRQWSHPQASLLLWSLKWKQLKKRTGLVLFKIVSSSSPLLSSFFFYRIFFDQFCSDGDTPSPGRRRPKHPEQNSTNSGQRGGRRQQTANHAWRQVEPHSFSHPYAIPAPRRCEIQVCSHPAPSLLLHLPILYLLYLLYSREQTANGCSRHK